MLRLILAGTILISILHIFDCQEVCFKAKTCLHNSTETCGFDKEQNSKRRFLDYCDIYEYNCERKADYVEVPISECDGLPPIPGEEKEKLKAMMDVSFEG